MKQGKTLISLASWAQEPDDVRLQHRLAALWAWTRRRPSSTPPPCRDFQIAAIFRPTEKIPVAPARGWLLILDEEKHDVPAARLTDAYKDRVLLVEDRFDRDRLGSRWKTVGVEPAQDLARAGEGSRRHRGLGQQLAP